MFLDEAEIVVFAGQGGPGIVSFLREKFRPKGGPDGGNGGDGGSVVLVSSTACNTLVDYRYHGNFRGERGGSGGSNNRTGRKGRDLLLVVPPGTLVWDRDTGALLGDLDAPDRRLVVAAGGKGGRGNASFATATRRAPRNSQPGVPGEERRLRLELKLLADVGLIGMPSTGKSTLIRRISSARPKIGAYPFTTLVPHLGVVERGVEEPFVVADVPGLIPGASEGAGLGLRFLRHVERTRVLVHLLDPAAGRDPVEDHRAIRQELGLFSEELLARPEVVILSKADTLADPAGEAARVAAALGLETVYPVSGVTGAGVEDLVRLLARRVALARADTESV
ncbi:MAG: GTPase ObgE [Deltaproteobacteria bacterium]|nr:GTPase ObgE [Deltaproteobacteria bacterium]